MSASSDYLSVLSDISRAKAAATSEAARQNGAIWGNTIANIGQMVAQYPEQQARMKEIANRAALTDLEKQREQRIAANEQRQQQAQQAATQALSQLQKTPDGLWDVNDAMTRLGTTGLDPAHVESFTTGLQKLNDMTVAERKRQEDANADRAHSFLNIYKGDEPITPESMSFNAEALKGIGGMTDADAQAIHDITQSVPPGTDLRPLLKAIEQKSEKYKPKYATAAEGSTIYDQTTGQTVGTPAPKKPKTWAEMGLDAQDPNSPTKAASAAALEAHAKLATPKSVTPGSFEDFVIKKYGADASPENILKARGEYGRADDRVAGAQAADITNLTPAGIDMAALNYRKTGQLPPLGMGDRTTRQKILNRAAELTPADIIRIEAGGTDVAANKAGYKADSTSLTALQKQRDAIGAFENTAQKNIDNFLSVAEKVVDTGIPLLNTPARWIAGAGGSADMAKYNAARQVAVSEIAKIVQNPNLSGQLSDSARHEIEVFNPTNATLAQTKAVMNLLKQDMQNRKTSLDDQLKDVRARIGGGSSTPASAPASTPATPGLSYGDYLKSKGGKP